MQMAPSPPPVSPVRGKRRTGGLRLAFRCGGMSVAKLTVGLLTGGLGILSKAIHSSLGLASSTMTFFAARVSGTPADEKRSNNYVFPRKATNIGQVSTRSPVHLSRITRKYPAKASSSIILCSISLRCSCAM